MAKLFSLVAIVSMSFLGLNLHAESLAEKAKWKEIESSVATYDEQAKTACGAAIKTVIDKKKSKTDKGSDHFTTPTWTLAQICGKGADEKDLVSKKIKTVEISFGSEIAVSHKGTALVVVTNPDKGYSDLQTAITTFVMEKME